jgi:hypothetical protein
MVNDKHVRVLLILLAIVSSAPSKHALCQDNASGVGSGRTLTVESRETLVQAVQNATPGTRILIAPGEYRGGLTFAELRGAKDRPIVLAALDPENPPIFIGGASGMRLTRPSHVQLQHLIFREATGNGLNIDDGGNADSPAHHIALRHLQVRDIGPRGNRDGIKLSGVDRFTVEHCTIERWGESGSAIDMVGCHDGEIVECAFQYRGDLFANGVQTKGGSSDITIKRCRFDHAGGRAVNIGGSTGLDYFRPRAAPYEAKNIVVEDCVFIGSMSPIVFVGVDGATVRYNTIYRPSRWVLRILQESQAERFVPCRQGSFTNNLIAFRADELRTMINVGGGTSPDTFALANNHWYCIDNPGRSRPRGLPVAETNGKFGQDPEFVSERENDLRLTDTTPVRDAGVRWAAGPKRSQ